MPPGFILYSAGVICALVFLAHTVRENQQPGGMPPSWTGWLLLTLALLCFAAGTMLLAVSVFSS